MIRGVLSFAVGVVLILFGSRATSLRTTASAALLVPPHELPLFSLGYSEVIADVLWLRVIQDFDLCGHQERKDVTAVPTSAIESVHGRRIGRCEESWTFHMIDAITELAPQFRMAFSSGAVILSVAVDDVGGAAKIYEKAARQFPHDWNIEYRAAYHALYELGDRALAADLLYRAGKDGGPYWLPILASRLYSKAGAAELGKHILEDFVRQNPDQADNTHVKQRMAEIERDLHAQEEAPAPAAAAKGP